MLRRLIWYSYIFAVRMIPALNGSFVLQCFECGNPVELRNGIMIDFYSGLPHIILTFYLNSGELQLYSIHSEVCYDHQKCTFIDGSE